ncbi:hypothetical protein FTUN_4924 [Frigoriglobus tundricola]|uniref:Uncharacterized protein n=1 Tax=Frigoriglobus tundricola TaxID=2774151 RepID=A0A6M5YVM1_9BACT|nr:hypothetical protein FTUN_4924 [Frigoriglobus tundricola]
MHPLTAQARLSLPAPDCVSGPRTTTGLSARTSIADQTSRRPPLLLLPRALVADDVSRLRRMNDRMK